MNEVFRRYPNCQDPFSSLLILIADPSQLGVLWLFIKEMGNLEMLLKEQHTKTVSLFYLSWNHNLKMGQESAKKTIDFQELQLTLEGKQFQHFSKRKTSTSRLHHSGTCLISLIRVHIGTKSNSSRNNKSAQEIICFTVQFWRLKSWKDLLAIKISLSKLQICLLVDENFTMIVLR